MDFYTKNTEALQKRGIKLEEINTFGEKLDFSFLPAKKQGHTLKIKGRAINSSYNPQEEAEDTVKAWKSPYHKTCVLFGFGGGEFFRAFCLNESKFNQLMVIEPNADIFREALKYGDFSDLIGNRRISFHIGKSAQEIYSFITDHFLDYVAASAEFYSVPAYAEIYIDYFRQVIASIKDASITCTNNLATLVVKGDKTNENIISNINSFVSSPHVSDFKNKFSGIPAVIVSAGPSLDKNVDLLKEVKGKFLICATDTAFKILAKHSITPDLVFTLDLNDISEKHFQGIDASSVPLVFDVEASAKTLQAHGGKTIATASNKPLAIWLSEASGRTSIMDHGMSVAHTIFYALVEFGSSPIIFVGQDLAYTGGKTHAEGTHSRLEVKKTDKYVDGKIMTVKSEYTGEELITREDMYVYLKFFEKMISDTKAYAINATEGGAGIKGAKSQTLQETIKEFAKNEHNFAEMIDQVFKNYKKVDISAFIKKKEELLKKIEKIEKASAETSIYLKNIIEEAEKTGVNKILISQKLKQIEKPLQILGSEEFVLRIIYSSIMKEILQQRREGIKSSLDFMNLSNEEYLLSLKEDYSFQSSVNKAMKHLLKSFSQVATSQQ